MAKNNFLTTKVDSCLRVSISSIWPGKLVTRRIMVRACAPSGVGWDKCGGVGWDNVNSFKTQVAL